MFNLRLCNAATILYSQLKFGQMHLCNKAYKYFSPNGCKFNSFGCTATTRCGSTSHGTHKGSVYSGRKPNQFDSLRLVREASFPNRRQVLIGSNQQWCVSDSPYYREYEANGSNRHRGTGRTWHKNLFYLYYIWNKWSYRRGASEWTWQQITWTLDSFS